MSQKSPHQNNILFVNVTKQCNVECTRCYLTKENRSKKFELTTETLGKALKSDDFASSISVVIWQGGEASLIGHDSFLALIELVRLRSPQARQTVVTNLLVLPNWLIELSHKYFESRIESTFAFGEKFTLDGSQDKYLQKFKTSLKKASDNNLKCVVNFELNKESVKMGPRALVAMLEETKHPYWEFDISVDFKSFLSFPFYNEFGYPILTPTVSNQDFYQYLMTLTTEYKEKLDNIEFESSFIRQFHEKDTKNNAFNTSMESTFITINPDGNITTNPLFSDMAATFLGNVNTTDIRDILRSRALIKRIGYENRRKLPCFNCQFFNLCDGGPSHIPLNDKSTECAGGFKLWEAL